VIGFRSLMPFGFRGALLVGAVSSLGFFLGGFPFWYANLLQEPKFASFEVLFGQSGISFSDLVANLKGCFTVAFPIIIGARRFWTTVDILPGLTTVAYAVY